MPGQLCLGLHRGVGAMVAHPPVVSGPGTYRVELASQLHDEQLVSVVLSRGTDPGSPDWAHSVEAALECLRPCRSGDRDGPRRCRPIVRFHNTPELGLSVLAPHDRHEPIPGHRAEHHEIQCSLGDEFAFPLDSKNLATAEILVDSRSLGWRIDDALVSGIGPSYRRERPRWSCERRDGTPVDGVSERLFGVGLPFAGPSAETGALASAPGYELGFEHRSPGWPACTTGVRAGDDPETAWMCVLDAGHGVCDPVDCPVACGDGVCDVWEKCSTCAQDCGVCREPAADLVATAITCTPGIIDAGDSLDCAITLANLGDEGAYGFTTELWLSRDAMAGEPDSTPVYERDRWLADCPITRLDAGATETVACSATLPAQTVAGAWHVGVVGDSADAFAELDERNNRVYGAIEVISDHVPPADIAVTEFSCFGVTNTGSDVLCTMIVNNLGGTAIEEFQGELRLSDNVAISNEDTLLATCEFGALEPGQSQGIFCTGMIPLRTGTGEWFMGFIADPADTVFELDEDNNIGYKAIHVVPGPADLVVSSVSCPPSATSPGEVSCSVEIRNVGDRSVTSFGNEMRLSNDTTINNFDILLGTCDRVFNLGPGMSQIISCRGDIPAGIISTRYVGVIADSSRSVSEFDEDNNTGHDSVMISPGPADLTVSAPSCPFSVTAPGPISCSVRITNQGGSQALFFSNEMYLSRDSSVGFGDSLIGSCTVFSVAPGASQTVTCDGNVPDGLFYSTGYLVVAVDRPSTIMESDETNNTGASSILIW